MIYLDFSFITDCGIKRPANEDSCYAETIVVKGEEVGFFAVADGIGGHNKGEVASKMAIDTLKSYVFRHLEENVEENVEEIVDLEIMLSRAFYEANKLVYEKATKEEPFVGMGTTLVASVINSNKLIASNVGDSRAYLFRNDTLEQLTVDNSYVQELVEKEIIKPEDAKTHPKRNVITRAIGTDKSVKVDFYDKELQIKDIVILCSDGLTDMVEDFEIEEVLKTGINPKDCCEALVALANEKGGKDNITIICVII